MVVGMFLGSSKRRAICFKLLVATINHIAGAHTHKRLLFENPPGVLPQFKALQHSEILYCTELAVALVFKKHNIVHLAQRRAVDVYRISNAFLYRLHILVVQQCHTGAVLRHSHRVEVTEQCRIDSIFVVRQLVEWHRAAFSPFTLQLTAADIVVHVVAVLYQAVLLMLIRITVGSDRLQRLLGKRHKPIVVSHHQRRYSGKSKHQCQQQCQTYPGQTVPDTLPENGKQHHGDDKKHHKSRV